MTKLNEYIIEKNNYCFDDEKLYWNNQDGWVSRDNATVFSDEEKRNVNLPMEGNWKRIDELTFQEIMQYLLPYFLNLLMLFLHLKNYSLYYPCLTELKQHLI